MPKLMDLQTFIKRVERINSLPTLPAIAMEVNKMLRDCNITIQSLSRTIEKDQSIVTRILQLVNSAFFGLRFQVSTISEAVILLGFHSVQNVVMSVSVIKAFRDKECMKGFDITDFWKHSIAVAMTSKYLAEKTKLQAPDNCFIAGLIHDIGKILLSQYFKEEFRIIWSLSKKYNISFYEAETQIMPATHAYIGAILAQKWQLPLNLIESIQYHHSFPSNIAHYDLLIIIYTANIIVNALCQTPPQKIKLSKIHPNALKLMKRQLIEAPKWFSELQEEMKEACDFFFKN